MREVKWGGAPAPRGLSRVRMTFRSGAWKPRAALERRPTVYPRGVKTNDAEFRQ
jgi:hypothetical protein